ncbi:MAG TPA: flagellar protein FlgN [Gammaproteobacteria bacterium]|jgi:flagellar biosynthesis/type III secretory pathway chaperone|nr:flagellar protein FlgN [Gammaproteobacteria bacterium]
MQHVSEGLIAVLKEQIHCAEAMLETLGRENRALTSGDAEELNAAGADKARLVEALESLERQRRSLTAAVAAAAPPEWRRLLDLIGQCKVRNERNGALVKARSEQVRGALRALRGTQPDLYGRSGIAPATADGRSLGSA